MRLLAAILMCGAAWSAPDRPLRAAFLVVDGVYNTELTAPYDLLEHVAYAVKKDPAAHPIEVFTVSPDGKTVTTAEGLKITPDYSFANHPKVDILVVPSAEKSTKSDLDDERLVGWVREQGGQARYVVSLCWGAFLLAKAGLLDEHRATTFPSSIDELGKRFGKVTVERGPSFVHDGKMLTSQGGVKSFDVAMYLVDHLYGEAVATRVGGGLIIDWPPAKQVGLVVAK